MRSGTRTATSTRPTAVRAQGVPGQLAIETTPNPPGFLGGQTNSCLAVIDASSRTVIAEVQLPAFAGSHSVAADSRNHQGVRASQRFDL